ncbi:ABC transporter ATP-binding protein [Bacillus alkalicellulosilyticus]|uniref:ABC transporter ATP-binding protein n=1 Tax=Alkalihalobacterium alkalicellulosilyticum TaxID=1912214 RepID=UPI0009981147|nr:ABC transporter ATP-binding protein [Bacillus alkalicellulosilyticus]
MTYSIKMILSFFDKKERKKLLILFFMMIVAAIFETVGIGLIVPFVGVVTNPLIIQEQAILAYIYKLFNFQSSTSFIIFSVVFLLGIFVFKNFYLLFFYYAQNRVILNQQVKLSSNLFKEYLTKPYPFHLQRNTAELLRNVNNEVPKVFQGIIMSGFYLLTEVLVITCIFVLLLITSPIATLTASILLSVSVFLFFKLFKKKISKLGKEQQQVTGNMIKWVNQGLGASKEVKVSGKESFFINAYKSQSQINANNKRYLNMLEQAPRLFIETILVSIVLITMLIIIFQGTNTTQVVSTMALFAMAAFRLMPSINRVVGMITGIRYSYPALAIIYKDLFEDNEKYNDSSTNKKINLLSNKNEKTFKDTIVLKDISFRYPEQKQYAVRDVSLTIPIGKSVAFIGESGAGKTTVVDIILGLLQPEKGSILVDEIKLIEQIGTWQNNIGYIPQSIFLSDDTIRGNVAFGIDNDEIDDNEVWRSLEQAKLKDFVLELPEKLDTKVGERGVRLSGGQRQRIGIARALYHNPEILFMDEATSALDSETEMEIMKAIDGLKGQKTLIIIAHRLSTIKNCDITFTIHKGRLVSSEYNLEKSIM